MLKNSEEINKNKKKKVKCNKNNATMNNSAKIKKGDKPRTKKSEQEKNVFRCDICFKKFVTLMFFQKHKEKHLNIDLPNKCDICFRVYSTENQLARHKLCFHKKGDFKCNECDEEFMNKSLLLKHQYKYHLAAYKCKYCSKSFNKKSKLTKHRKSHLKKLKHPCLICGMRFENDQLLTQHKSISCVENNINIIV